MIMDPSSLTCRVARCLHSTRATIAVAALCAIVSPVTVQAQTFPSKLVRIVVPFPAGGAFDTTARVLAQRMQAGLGQTVVVENRPGGGTVIGTEYVARQPADGHTILLIEALRLSAKADIVHASFQGAAPAVPAIVGGHVTAGLLNLSDMVAFIKSDGERYRRIIREANVRVE
jgi:tripartite-type tricarboxylate transporter receptor subunit TctC